MARFISRVVLVALMLMVPAGRVSARTWMYIQEGSPLSYRPGTSAPPADWNQPGYQEDGTWVQSDQGFGIGYGDGDDQTVLSDMRDGYVTVYVRAHFQAGPEMPTTVKLDVSFDDGFVVYINGTEVGRSHVPSGDLGPDDTASGHEVTDGDESFDVDPGLLVSGDNVLAVEVHNAGLSSSDLSFLPTLWGYDSPPVDAQITMGPFVQQLGRNSVLVVWETDQDAPTELVWGTDSDNLTETVSDQNATTHHVVTLQDLVAQSRYSYRVDSARWPSSVGTFQTVKDMATPFRVAVYGDCRSDHEVHRQVVDGMLSASPDLVFNTGDLVADGTERGLWVTFFDVTADMVRDLPMYPVLGNHEQDGNLYLEIFELPTDSSGTERYYATRYGVALFVIIDLYGSDWGEGSDQYNWLEQVLSEGQADPSIRHIFAFLHHGPYDSGSHGPNTSAQRVLAPLFEQYGVDIVFSGHDHDYERSTVNGVKYVVTGGGGAGLYAVDGDWWTEVSESVYHYCIFDVTGPKVDYVARRMDGSLLDEFTLGDDVSECESADDCTGGQEGDCTENEEGAWACVSGSCIWTCHDTRSNVPDGGMTDGCLVDGGSSDSDAAVSGDAGGSGDDASESEGGGESDGCGCRSSVGGADALVLFFFLFVFVALVRRRVR